MKVITCQPARRQVSSTIEHQNGKPVLAITTLGKTTCYDVIEHPCCDGRLFELVKGDTHCNVLIHTNGQDHSCDCADMTFRGHLTGNCKHIRAMLEQIDFIADPLSAFPEPAPCPKCGGETVSWGDASGLCVMCAECVTPAGFEIY